MKPTLEAAAGQFLHVSQSNPHATPYTVQRDSTTYDELPPSMFEGRNPLTVRPHAVACWGSWSFAVSPSGALALASWAADSSD